MLRPKSFFGWGGWGGDDDWSRPKRLRTISTSGTLRWTAPNLADASVTGSRPGRPHAADYSLTNTLPTCRPCRKGRAKSLHLCLGLGQAKVRQCHPMKMGRYLRTTHGKQVCLHIVKVTVPQTSHKGQFRSVFDLEKISNSQNDSMGKRTWWQGGANQNGLENMHGCIMSQMVTLCCASHAVMHTDRESSSVPSAMT